MREIDIVGVYVSPFLRDLVVAALVFLPVKLGLDRLAFDRAVWHRPLADVALFGCTVAAVTFCFASGIA